MARSRWAMITLVASLLLPQVPAGAVEVDKSKNVTLLSNDSYEGGTELAAQGRFLYSAELNGGPAFPSRNTDPDKGGLRIYKILGNGGLKQVGFLHCPGNDNDVEIVEPGLVVMSFHVNSCAPPKDGESANGIMLVDVSKASKPKIVSTFNLPTGGSAHTLRVHPGGDHVYVNPGGLPTNGGGNEHIVDISNRSKPKLAAVFGRTNGGPFSSCHDLSFHADKKQTLAFCAGKGKVDIWDVSDPVAPVSIGGIVNPVMMFEHYAVASSDGKILAIDDEAFAFHECRTNNSPTGRVWFYDISDPTAPKLLSSFAPPRGGDSTGVGHFTGWIPSWCLSHGLDWKPKTHEIAVTWFTGGVSVLSLEDDPTAPKEVAHFQAENSCTYSALWHNGILYTNDSCRGVDALKVKL